MKLLLNRKLIYKLFVCVVLYTLAEVLRDPVIAWTKNGKVGQVISVFEVVLALCFAKNLLGELLKQAESSKNGVVRSVLRFLKRLVKPLTDGIAEKYARSQKRIIGRDKREIAIPWKFGKNKKDPPLLREKVKLNGCQSNEEIIRTLYISRILRLKATGRAVEYSETPREIKTRHASRKDDTLFDVYENVRYGYNVDVDDETASFCQRKYDS